MNLAGFRTLVWIAIFSCICLLGSGRLWAQAPAGPMTPTHPLPPPPKAPPAKKKPEVESRSSLAGYWKLNKEESDDAKAKIEDSRRKDKSDDPTMGGNRRVGIGYPYPGGGPGGPGGPNGPYGGPGGDDRGDARNAELEEYVRPMFAQTIELKQNEVDSTNEQDAKTVMFTDNRKLPKDKGNGPRQILARWDGAKLVTDEKGPGGRKISCTYELSFDGKQIYETWRIENKKSDRDIIIRYVYDAAINEHL